MGISIGQLIVILIIVALLFGTKKLRNIGGDLGNAIKSFRKAVKEGDDDTDAKDNTPEHGTVIEGETKPLSESDNKSP
jgi:sec-independent protein translocase protein TatA